MLATTKTTIEKVNVAKEYPGKVCIGHFQYLDQKISKPQFVCDAKHSFGVPCGDNKTTHKIEDYETPWVEFCDKEVATKVFPPTSKQSS